jgi:hypothetical protein
MGIHGNAEDLDYLERCGIREGHPEVDALEAELDLEDWFFDAIAEGNVDAVRYLLEVGMSADMISSLRGVRGLSEACRAGHLDVAKLLRAHGASMIVRYGEGEDAVGRGPSNEFLQYSNQFLRNTSAPDVRGWVLSQPRAGDGLFFAAPPPAGRPPAADAAKWWGDTGVQRVARYYTALPGSRRFQAQRWAPHYWIRLRTLVATRRIMLYWQEYTQARLCAPGGSQRAADEAAFKADLAPAIDQDQAEMRPCARGGLVRIADQAPSAADLAQYSAIAQVISAAQVKKADRDLALTRRDDALRRFNALPDMHLPEIAAEAHMAVATREAQWRAAAKAEERRRKERLAEERLEERRAATQRRAARDAAAREALRRRSAAR